MKYISGFLFLFFMVTSLEASYLRSIRIASAHTKADAEKILAEVNIFSQTNNLDSLQNKHSFEYKIVKVDKHYRVVAEPLSDRELVQHLLDTFRLEYRDAYPKKIVAKKDDKEIKTVEVVEKVQKKRVLIEDAVTEEKVPIQIEKKKKLISQKIDTQKIKVEKKSSIPDPKPTPLPKQNLEKTTHIWQILFALCFILLIVAIRIIFTYKRKNEIHVDKDMISNEKLEYSKLEIAKKESFLSHASHELRTPMTAIMGLTHLILESDLTKTQKDYIQRIENSTNNLLNIINDILDISKIEAGELKLEKIEFNINDILDYVLTIIMIQAKNNNIKISMEVDNDVASHMVGDSLRLGQILINLLSNAVKFTKDGEVSLSVKKLSSYGNSLTLEFVVKDTGIGMTQSQVENVFQSYSQASESTSRQYGGTGLGLAISKQLIEVMNGEISVTSEKNIGTTFTFSLVFKLKDAENKRQYRLPSSSLLNKRILIVDSSNKNAISLIRTLGYFNYKTHSIPSFEEAILESNMLFDIVLINQLNLTKTTLNKIKKMQSRNKIKVVLLHDLYSSVNKEKSRDIDIGAYLSIPFTQQSVLNMIIELYVSKNLDQRSRKKSIKAKLQEFKGNKILLVEDNELNHKVISGLLSGTGIELSFALNGQEGIDALRKNIKFDLVLMDINMPIMNGYEAVKIIRKNKKFNKLPIIALTADVMDDSIEKAISCGMQDHIAKPIVIDTIYQKILATFKNKEIKIDIEQPSELKVAKQYEELSIEIGLNRCNGDKKFYRLILKDFQKMYAKSPLFLQESCTDGDFKSAKHKAMDIKDISLNIGAYNLCESAAMMEYEFEKGSRSSWTKLIKFYTISLKKLFKEIDEYLED